MAEAFSQAVDNNAAAQIQKFAVKACFSSIYDREEAFVNLAIKDMMARLKKPHQGTTRLRPDNR